MKVLIATSSPTPQLSTFFSQSLAETYALGAKEDIEFKFYWSPNEDMYKNESIAAMEDGGFDSVFFIKPHIEWRALDLVNIVKNDALICGVATRQFYVPNQTYKVVLNPIKEDAPVTAIMLDLDFINIKKEVFERVRDFVLVVSAPKEENIIEQIPVYFYTTSDSEGIKTQDTNFCLAVQKAEIPIEINTNMKIYEHIWTPQISDIGMDIQKQYTKEKMKEVESI